MGAWTRELALFTDGLKCKTKEAGCTAAARAVGSIGMACTSVGVGLQGRHAVTLPRWTPRPDSPNPAFVSLEYAENIGDGRSPEFRESEQKRILGLLENF